MCKFTQSSSPKQFTNAGYLVTDFQLKFPVKPFLRKLIKDPTKLKKTKSWYVYAYGYVWLKLVCVPLVGGEEDLCLAAVSKLTKAGIKGIKAGTQNGDRELKDPPSRDNRGRGEKEERRGVWRLSRYRLTHRPPPLSLNRSRTLKHHKLTTHTCTHIDTHTCTHIHTPTRREEEAWGGLGAGKKCKAVVHAPSTHRYTHTAHTHSDQIGRASCRERV